MYTHGQHVIILYYGIHMMLSLFCNDHEAQLQILQDSQ